jgi:hypothetical protein
VATMVAGAGLGLAAGACMEKRSVMELGPNLKAHSLAPV